MVTWDEWKRDTNLRSHGLDFYTERGEDLHGISLREATKHEARHYFKAISHEA